MLLANLSIANFPNDIGSFFNLSMSTTDIVSIINSLSQEQKYNLLKCHFVRSDIFHFPRNIVQALIVAFRIVCAAGWDVVQVSNQYINLVIL